MNPRAHNREDTHSLRLMIIAFKSLEIATRTLMDMILQNKAQCSYMNCINIFELLWMLDCLECLAFLLVTVS